MRRRARGSHSVCAPFNFVVVAENLEIRQLLSTATPVGMTPQQLQHAYGVDQISLLPGSIKGDGTGQTIAISAAFDNPKLLNSTDPNFASSDLHNFDMQLGLADPPSFKKVYQDGSNNLPSVEPITPGPGVLDEAYYSAMAVEAVHAMAPGANILLVEGKGVGSKIVVDSNYARTQPGVSVILLEDFPVSDSGDPQFDTYYTTPSGHGGVTFVAPSGDFGAPATATSYSPNIVGVGGTTLSLSATGDWQSETAWNKSGGGISQYEPQPAFQSGIVSQGIMGRAAPDVALMASNGFPIYDSYNNGSQTPWTTVTGTKISAALFSGMVAIANQARALNGQSSLDGPSQLLPGLYAPASTDFHDIVTGSNNAYSAAAGYDLVSGRGSPIANRLIPDLAGQTHVARPGSDAFGNAIYVNTDTYSGTVSNINATKEPGEPAHAGDAGGASVWWRWATSHDGTVTISTAGSGIDTVLGVYNGLTVNNLSLIASNDNAGGSTTSSQVTFAALAGQGYIIAVDGHNGGSGAATGNISLTINQSAAPALPVAWYQLDDLPAATIFDNSTSHNSATLINGASVANAPRGSIQGSVALSLNGTNQYATAPNIASTDPTSALSISAWINATDWNGNRRIVQKGAGDNQYRLLAESGLLKFDLAGVGAITAPLPTTGAWHLVTATYGSGSETIYVDGKQVATAARSGTVATTGDPLIIGTKTGSDSFPGDYFKGFIDDVRVWNRAVSAAEVTALYAADNLPNSPPVITQAAAAGAISADGTNVPVSVLASDPESAAAALAYSWTAAGPGAVAFAANGNYAARSTTATFSQAGLYTLTVKAQDPGGLTATSSVFVTVTQQETSIGITPINPAVQDGGSTQLTATALDQFAKPLTLQPLLKWVSPIPSGAGTIIATDGRYTAPATGSGTDTVTVRDVANGFAASTNVTYAPVTFGLAASYSFSENSGATTADSSGNGNSATLVNGASFGTGRTGAGNALSVNGNAQYARVADSTSLDPTSAITLSAWINAGDWNGNRRILQKGSNDNQYRLLAENGLLKFDLTGVGSLTATLPAAGAWHLVSATWDGASMKVYIDAQLVASAAHAGSISTTIDPLVVGNKSISSTVAGDSFKGLLDDVRIYSRAIAASEVSTLFTIGSVPNTPPAITQAAASGALSADGKSSAVSVLASDTESPAASLVYTWSATGPGTVSFAANANATANNTTATFSQAGSYTLTAKVQDPGGLTASSSIIVAVTQQETGLSISPANPTVQDGATQQFTAAALDQFLKPMTTQPTLTWSVTGVGTVSASAGLYTAPVTGSGSDTLTVRDNARNLSANTGVTYTAAAGVVAAYTFSETSGATSADGSGNNNTATLVNGATFVSGRTGAGNALSLNGSSQYARVADSASLDPTSAITLSAWVNATDWNGNRRILQKGAGDNQYRLLIENGALKFDLAGVLSITTAPPATGSWHLVTATYDGAAMKIYIDTTLVANTPHTGSIAKTTDPLVIGNKSVGDTFPGNSFKGLIDDVRIYNRAIPASEVTALFSAGTVANTAPVITRAAVAGTIPADGKSVPVSVLASDAESPASALNYLWTFTGPGVVSFVPSGNNAAQNTTATFSQAGTYTLTATAQDPGRLIATSSVIVTIAQQETSLSLTPVNPSVSDGSTQQFTATALDQFQKAMATQPALTWSLTGAGTVNTTGLYAAPTTGSGSDTVTVKDNARTLATSSTVSYAAASTGLAVNYSFSESSGSTTADSSGNANNATLVNGATFAAGRAGNALSLNGSAQFARTADSATLDPTSAITLSAWIDATDWSGNRRILQKGAGDNQYRLLAENGLLKFDLTGVGSLTATLPAAGAWHLVTATYDGASMKIYVDAQLVGSAAHTGSISKTTDPLVVGHKSVGDTSAGDSFKGLIDDVRIYNRAISATEISAIFQPPPVNHAPTFVNAATAEWINDIPYNTILLQTQGADVDTPASGLTYTWSTTSPGVTFDFTNGTTAGILASARVTAAGSYNFTVTITDPGGLSVTSTTVTAVIVPQVYSSVAVTPGTSTIFNGADQSFSGYPLDQFHAVLLSYDSYLWSVMPGGVGGTLNPNLVYTAPLTGTGSDEIDLTVTAQGKTMTASATVNVFTPLAAGAAAKYSFDETSGTTASDSGFVNY